MRIGRLCGEYLISMFKGLLDLTVGSYFQIELPNKRKGPRTISKAFSCHSHLRNKSNKELCFVDFFVVSC